MAMPVHLLFLLDICYHSQLHPYEGDKEKSQHIAHYGLATGLGALVTVVLLITSATEGRVISVGGGVSGGHFRGLPPASIAPIGSPLVDSWTKDH